MLIKEEQELQKVKQDIGKVLNVPVQPLAVMKAVNYVHPAFMPRHLRQWRLLLQFDSLILVEPQLWSEKLTVSYTFMDRKREHVLVPTWISQTQAIIDFPKLYFVFADNDELMKNMFKDMQVEFYIGGMRGVTNPFYKFTANIAESVGLSEKLEILLLKTTYIKARLNMTVFIAKDMIFDMQELPITINRYGSVYIPEDTYMTSEPMPEAWMERFGKKFEPMPLCEQVLESSQELEDAYTPKVSKEVMLNDPLMRSKVLHTNYDLKPESINTDDNRFRKVTIANFHPEKYGSHKRPSSAKSNRSKRKRAKSAKLSRPKSAGVT